jgi:hypothetical protein
MIDAQGQRKKPAALPLKPLLISPSCTNSSQLGISAKKPPQSSFTALYCPKDYGMLADDLPPVFQLPMEQ